MMGLCRYGEAGEGGGGDSRAQQVMGQVHLVSFIYMGWWRNYRELGSGSPKIEKVFAIFTYFKKL
jgi:hypothetical protein